MNRSLPQATAPVLGFGAAQPPAAILTAYILGIVTLAVRAGIRHGYCAPTVVHDTGLVGVTDQRFRIASVVRKPYRPRGWIPGSAKGLPLHFATDSVGLNIGEDRNLMRVAARLNRSHNFLNR